MNSLQSFDAFYEKYSPVVYGIACEVAESPEEADKIFTTTFLKVHERNLFPTDSSKHCISIIKLTMVISYEILKPTAHLKLKQFQNTPLLHKIVCEDTWYDSRGNKSNALPEYEFLKIREELNFLRL